MAQSKPSSEEKKQEDSASETVWEQLELPLLGVNLHQDVVQMTLILLQRTYGRPTGLDEANNSILINTLGDADALFKAGFRRYKPSHLDTLIGQMFAPLAHFTEPQSPPSLEEKGKLPL